MPLAAEAMRRVIVAADQQVGWWGARQMSRECVLCRVEPLVPAADHRKEGVGRAFGEAVADTLLPLGDRRPFELGRQHDDVSRGGIGDAEGDGTATLSVVKQDAASVSDVVEQFILDDHERLPGIRHPPQVLSQTSPLDARGAGPERPRHTITA